MDLEMYDKKTREILTSGDSERLKNFAIELLGGVNLQQVRWQGLLDVLEEAVCVIDDMENVIGWNRRAEALYGISAMEIIGQPIEKFFSNLLLTRAMKDGKVLRETYHKPCPGTHVLINAQPIYFRGRVAGGVSAEREITELVNLNQKLSQASQEVQTLREEIDKIQAKTDEFSAIYGHSPLIAEAVRVARRVATANVPILLRGESGSGKELFARAIHDASHRNGSFVAINCGAIPANLFESELFGYESGAFTGADRKGKFGFLERSHGGTLFLDEIGEMPKDMQVKLLRVLQEQIFYRVGSTKPVHVDLRVIAATHRDLEGMINRGEFREDLYYRMNVVTIPLPSLRERREDIPELVHRGLRYFGNLHAKVIQRIDPAVMAALLDYEWPGNVRELFNVLERMVILCDGDTLNPENLPINLTDENSAKTKYMALSAGGLNAMTEDMERNLIQRVLEESGNNKAIAAQKLGIPRSTLYYKMNSLRIGVKDLTQVSEN